MAVNFGGPGVTPNLGSLVSNSLALQPGEVWTVPSGRFAVKPGKYTVFQEYDAVAQFWRTIGGGATNANLEVVFSDGTNYRFANQTGCAVGALITNVGSGYTSAPIVTASAGGSVWRAIVGGAVNTTVTVTNGGVNYTYPPTVLFSAPPAGGIPATGYCTLSAGAVSSVTIVDQGAGYNSPPTIVFVNDPRETAPPPGSTATTGYNAAAICTLTGAQTITGLLCVDHGTSLTSLPTLTFTGGGGASAAATVIMCWTITSYTVGTAGAGLAGTFANVSAIDAFPTTTPGYTNPTTQSQLVRTRPAAIKGTITAGAIVAKTALTLNDDGGIYTSVPLGTVNPTASVVTTAPVITCVMGGQNDVSFIAPT